MENNIVIIVPVKCPSWAYCWHAGGLGNVILANVGLILS